LKVLNFNVVSLRIRFYNHSQVGLTVAEESLWIKIREAFCAVNF